MTAQWEDKKEEHTVSSSRKTRRGLFIVLAIVVLLGASLGVRSVNQAQSLTEQRNQIKILEDKIAGQKQETADTIEKNTTDALGISRTRVINDSMIFNRLLGTAFTWDTGLSYEAARETVKDRFDLSENDVFLQEFLPPSRFNQDSSEKKYYYIDAVGLVSSFNKIVSVEVINVEQTRYRYMVIADVTITTSAPEQVDNRGEALSNPSTKRRVLLYATVDADGTISDLRGFPASGSTRSST